MALAAPIPALASGELTRTRVFDALAVAVLVVVAAIALATFRDYGLSWDDYAHSEYGDLLLAFYASGFADQRALSWVNLYMYGGGFDLLAALAAKVLPFTVFETRRLIGAAVGMLGLFVTWRIGRRIGGPPGGADRARPARHLPALLRPHVHEPEGFAVRGRDGDSPARAGARVREYPRVRSATGALVGIGFGLSFGSRIMGAFGAIEALAALALVAGGRGARRRLSRRRAGAAGASCCRSCPRCCSPMR